MKSRIITLLLIVFLISCSEQKKAVQNNDTLDNKMTIINSPEYIKWITGKNYNSWKPNDSELKEVDSILQKALNDGKFSFLKTQTLKELKERYRQYLCYINEDGDKIIHINSFCKIPTTYDNGKEKPLDWKNEMIDTADGGSCYWNMKINLTSKSFYDLIINGES